MLDALLHAIEYWTTTFGNGLVFVGSTLNGSPEKPEEEPRPAAVFPEAECEEGFAELKRGAEWREGRLTHTRYVKTLDRTEMVLDEEHAALNERLRIIRQRSVVVAQKEKELQGMAEEVAKEAKRLLKEEESKALAEKLASGGAAQHKAINDQITQGLRQHQVNTV